MGGTGEAWHPAIVPRWLGFEPGNATVYPRAGAMLLDLQIVHELGGMCDIEARSFMGVLRKNQ